MLSAKGSPLNASALACALVLFVSNVYSYAARVNDHLWMCAGAWLRIGLLSFYTDNREYIDL